MPIRILVAAACFAFGLGAADENAAKDPWAKVKELRGGQEVRYVRQGAEGKPPVEAKWDTLTEESLLLVVKNEQLAIPRAELVRLDARPVSSGSRKTKTETTTKFERPETRPTPMGVGTGVPGSSSSSSTTIVSKPAYETVYRRMAGAK